MPSTSEINGGTSGATVFPGVTARFVCAGVDCDSVDCDSKEFAAAVNKGICAAVNNPAAWAVAFAAPVCDEGTNSSRIAWVFTAPAVAVLVPFVAGTACSSCAVAV